MNKQLESFSAQCRLMQVELVPAWKDVVAPLGLVHRNLWCKLYACYGDQANTKLAKDAMKKALEWEPEKKLPEEIEGQNLMDQKPAEQIACKALATLGYTQTNVEAKPVTSFKAFFY